ncbi:MAG: hypothetical protein V2B20_07675 [Pseudomonadota bacterium]
MPISVNANQPLLGSFESQNKNKESLQTNEKGRSTTQISDNLALSHSATKSAVKPDGSTTEDMERSGTSIMTAESAAARLEQTTKFIFSNNAIALTVQANISHQTALDLLTSR